MSRNHIHGIDEACKRNNSASTDYFHNRLMSRLFGIINLLIVWSIKSKTIIKYAHKGP